jgi:hypothetical protein
MKDSTNVITSSEMMSLSFQAVFVLLAGFILWRVIVLFNKKKSKPKGSSYFNSQLSDKWKGKR